jgi:LysM repeat protein
VTRGTEKTLFTLLTVGLAVVATVAILVTVQLLRPYIADPAQPTPVQPAASTEPPAPTPAPPTPIPPTDTPPPTSTPLPFSEGPFSIGTSFNGSDLLAYRLGTGASKRALIGAIHGGYEWNTVDLMSATLEHLQANPDLIPPHVTLYIVPCANPDGYAAGTDREHGRVNGNNVDLNRNWDYMWQMTATHGTRPVFAGTGPFSEPETRALRDFIEGNELEMVIFYHSAMAKIFSGADRTRSATYELAEMMAQVTGYVHDPEGIYGQITTGDAIDYLSVQGITAIEIELTNHQETDWEQNLRGVLAFLNWTLPPQAQHVRYEIQPNDTLLDIALRYGVDVEAIMLLNDIADENRIVAGDVLLIPIGE